MHWHKGFTCLLHHKDPLKSAEELWLRKNAKFTSFCAGPLSEPSGRQRPSLGSICGNITHNNQLVSTYHVPDSCVQIKAAGQPKSSGTPLYTGIFHKSVLRESKLSSSSSRPASTRWNLRGQHQSPGAASLPPLQEAGRSSNIPRSNFCAPRSRGLSLIPGGRSVRRASREWWAERLSRYLLFLHYWEMFMPRPYHAQRSQKKSTRCDTVLLLSPRCPPTPLRTSASLLRQTYSLITTRSGAPARCRKGVGGWAERFRSGLQNKARGFSSFVQENPFNVFKVTVSRHVSDYFRALTLPLWAIFLKYFR